MGGINAEAAMFHDKVYCLAAALVGFVVGCIIINAAGGQPSLVMRPSVDMAVQYKPALASQVKFMQPQTMMKTNARARMIPAKAEAELTRRAMVVLGLGVAAGKGAAVAAE